jgi:hypothetical protein
LSQFVRFSATKDKLLNERFVLGGCSGNVFECFLPNAVVEMEDKGESQATEQPGVPQELQGNQPDIKQVSICFRSDVLNHRVHERLSRITTETHSFLTGFHQNSSIVLTDFEEMAEEATAADKRIIMFEDSLSDDEIVRRAPIRLGLRG